MDRVFDKFLAIVVAVVALLTALDWLLGPKQRTRLREKVGDFWTMLHYSPLDELLVRALLPASRAVQAVYGEGRFSTKLVVTSFVTNVALIAIAPFLILGGEGRNFWEFFISSPPAFVGNVLGLPLLDIALLGWLPFKWISASFRRYVVPGATWGGFARAVSSLFAGILVFTAAYFVGLMALWFVILGPKDFPSQAEFQDMAAEVWSIWHPSSELQITPMPAIDLPAEPQAPAPLPDDTSPDGPSTSPRNTEAEPQSRSDITFDGGFGKALVQAIVAMMMFANLLGLVALVPVLAAALVLVVIVALKVARPVVQPVTIVLIERLYESKQGILTQLAIGIGFTVKLVQELSK